ncbi:MAG TPA: DUF3048 domain-containing protein, partial [Longilinea sp.]|nr:DUF3048 domain-containing protein [Longilinea sp.]
ACAPAADTTQTAIPSTSETPAPATATSQPPTPTMTSTPSYPAEGMGPTNWPAGVNPLTGLEVADPNLLLRRPIIIKVENLPRADRPQWGLSLADIVYEYYTEQGSTRFAAVFYGNDSTMVGPVRSGRFFDVNVVQMYKGIFIFGSAWEAVFSRFLNSDFYNRLVIESQNSYPALSRYTGSNQNFLIADTTQMSVPIANLGIDNSQQNLDNMFFQMTIPEGGQTATSVHVRYSGAIYNRWDFNSETNSYLRFVDTVDDTSGNGSGEVYGPLVDRSTNAQIEMENVVILMVPHQFLVQDGESEVVDMNFIGTGTAYVLRDGQIYQVTWQRNASDQIVALYSIDGQIFPLHPGTTWYEVIGASSTFAQEDASTYRFVHVTP